VAKLEGKRAGNWGKVRAWWCAAPGSRRGRDWYGREAPQGVLPRKGVLPRDIIIEGPSLCSVHPRCRR
jgi:hypothetical protein